MAKKRICFFALLLALSFQLSAQGANPIFDTLDGWLTIGSDISKVNIVLGQPDSVGDTETWSFSGQTYRSYFYNSKGLSIITETSDDQELVFFIDAVAPARFRTNRGVTIGSTKDDVMKLYPELTSLGAGQKEDTEVYSTHGTYYGTMFSFQNNLLVHIGIGTFAD